MPNISLENRTASSKNLNAMLNFHRLTKIFSFSSLSDVFFCKKGEAEWGERFGVWSENNC